MATTKKYVSLEKLGLYDQKIKGVISAGDEATLAAAKSFAEGLGVNYDVAGAAGTALTNAKSYTDTEVAKANSAAATAQAQADKGVADAAAADAKAVKAQEEVDALEGVVADLDAYVGDIPTGYTQETVIAYINKKAEETLAAAQGGSSETAASVKAQLDTYKADNDAAVAAVDGKADAAQAAADAAQEHSEGVAADLTAAVEALEGADSAQVERIATLEGQITGLTGAMHFKGVIETDPTTITSGYENGDTVIYGNKEYVFNNGAFVEFGDVDAQAEAITALTGRMTTAEGKITTSEGKITSLEGAVAGKVEQTVYDAKIAELAGADTTMSGKIQALEAKFGGAEGSVEDMIADAKAEAISEATATASSDATQKANTAESNSKSYTDTEVGKDRARLDALEAIDHDHSNKAVLDGITEAKVTSWDDASAKAHEHGNKTVLDGITAENITTWNTVTAKASQTDLDSAVARITANEENIAAFVEVSEEEILGLFQ